MRRIFGDEIRVGDTIEVWWRPNRDTIISLIPYEGPLKRFFEQNGGAWIAQLALNKSGMTICAHDPFNLISRIGEVIDENT